MMNDRKHSRWSISHAGVMVFGLMCMIASICVSCNKQNDDELYPNWKNENLSKWNSIYNDAKAKVAAGDKDWMILKSWSLEDSKATSNTSYIVVHVLKKGTGEGSPLFTDNVRVHYQGRLLPSPQYPQGYQFDSSWHKATSLETAIPAQFAVNQLTYGFATALQHMHIGDEWEIYVPWTLGYGDKETATIPAYSVLIFRLQLVDYFHAGDNVPAFKAKKQTLN